MNKRLMKELVKGNKRFISGSPKEKKVTNTKGLVNGQDPYLLVVSCSDSRVPPEVVLDLGIGEAFVIRTAGNVLGSIDMGSLEYAVEHLKIKGILVLAHNHCGVVNSAVSGKKEKGNINAVIKRLKPSLKAAKATGVNAEELCEIVENINAAITAHEIMCNKHIKDILRKKRIPVIPAKYLLETGEIKFIPAKHYLDIGEATYSSPNYNLETGKVTFN